MSDTSHDLDLAPDLCLHTEDWDNLDHRQMRPWQADSHERPQEREGRLWEGLSLKGRGSEEPTCAERTGKQTPDTALRLINLPGAVHLLIPSLSELRPNPPKTAALAPTYSDHTAGALAV